MAKFEKLFVNYALLGLLILSLLAFGFTLQTNNNASETIKDNTLLNESFGQLQTDLGGMRSK